MKDARHRAVALLLLAAAAPVPRGVTQELVIMNATAGPLECHAIAGHWYGFDLGVIAPDAQLTLKLQYDRASGTVAVINSRDRVVPLQSIYCGQPGQAWQTRADVPLRDPLENAYPVTCRAAVSGLRCGP